MATFNKFQAFVAALANGTHNLGSNQLTVALTDVAPVATNSVLADLTQIIYTNLSSRNITTSSSSQTSGTYNLKLSNLTLTATGNVAQFRYIVIYNSTAGSGNLIGWYDYAAELNLINSDQFVISFDATNGLLSIT